MRVLAALLLGGLLALPLFGCGAGGAHDADGLQECAFCTSTSQCDVGLACVPFTDGSTRCSRLGLTCP